MPGCWLWVEKHLEQIPCFPGKGPHPLQTSGCCTKRESCLGCPPRITDGSLQISQASGSNNRLIGRIKSETELSRRPGAAPWDSTREGRDAAAHTGRMEAESEGRQWQAQPGGERGMGGSRKRPAGGWGGTQGACCPGRSPRAGGPDPPTPSAGPRPCFTPSPLVLSWAQPESPPGGR